MSRLINIQLLAATLVACAASAEDRPNILLITADDLGLQLSCYGDDTIHTPHMDALAARGVQFTTAYVAQASCSPSRSAMFTGMYPHGNGHYGLANAGVGFRVHEKLLDHLLPNVLSKAGYRTGIIGKLHVNPDNAFAFDTRMNSGFGNRDIGLQVDHAKQFWADSADQPWFLMFNLFDPHVAKDKLPNKRKGPAYFPNVVKELPATPLSAADVKPWPWQRIGREQQLTRIAGYYNCVQRIDIAVGRLMASLADAGHTDNTLIIFLGDHGPPFTRGKTSCYEAGLRVPFLFVWPGVTKPHVSSKLVSAVDIYPTIMDAVGLEVPSAVHGTSLRAVATTTHNDSWRKTLVGEFHFHGASPFFPRRAITDGRYKLIQNLRAGQATAITSVDGDKANQWALAKPASDAAHQAFARLADPPQWELYDLKADPIEFNNIAGTPETATVESRLKRALRDWQTKTSDPFVDREFRQSVLKKFAK